LLEVRNFGETTLQEIEEKLQEHGLRLGMPVASAADA
jgi:DNA-directed RNA polymerase alpha subunit